VILKLASSEQGWPVLLHRFTLPDPAARRLRQILSHARQHGAGVSGEVLDRIGTRLKNESPFRNSIMVTHTNRSSARSATNAPRPT